MIYCRFSLFLKDPFFRFLRSRSSCRCFCLELAKRLPVHRYRVDIFHNVAFKQYWVLMESIILLKPVLGDMRIIALSISSHEHTQ